MTHYCHPENKNEHEPCLVEMFKKYFSLIKELKRINEAFYFRSSKTDIKFEIAPVGIPKLNSIVPLLMKEAGLEKKTISLYSCNYSYRFIKRKAWRKTNTRASGDYFLPFACMREARHVKCKEWPFQKLSDHAI